MTGADAMSERLWRRWCTPSGLYSDDDIGLDEIAVGFHVVDEEAETDADATVVEGWEG